MNIRGELDMEKFRRMLNKNTKLVAVVHVSNSLGTINPVKKIVAAAHAKNIPVLVDAAQSVQHMKIDVQDLDCDFLVFQVIKFMAQPESECYMERENSRETASLSRWRRHDFEGYFQENYL